MRAAEKVEIDGAMGLLNLHSQAKAVDNFGHSEDEYEDVKNAEMITSDYYLKPRGMQTDPEDSSGNGLDFEPAASLQQIGNGLDSEPAGMLQQTVNGNDEHGSENAEGIRLAKSVSEFKVIKRFDSFNMIIDGLIIDTEIPIHIRYKYYELCFFQFIALLDHTWPSSLLLRQVQIRVVCEK